MGWKKAFAAYPHRVNFTLTLIILTLIIGVITAPTLLTAEHSVDKFCSGNETLDSWLIKRALKNQDSGASKTFVITDGSSEVIGYYALATGSIERVMAPSNFSRQMPDPIPVIILARLAIHQAHQGKSLGLPCSKTQFNEHCSLPIMWACEAYWFTRYQRKQSDFI